MVARKVNKSGEDTRKRIIDAALETVRVEGLVGTSARVIAKTGGFNQALVFYHFGSIDELLLAALEQASTRRMDRFRDKIEAVDNFSALVQVAVQMHSDPDPDYPALTSIVGGWSGKSEIGSRIVTILKPWDDLISGALERSLAGTQFAQFLPTDDVARAISSLFLGIEIISRLDPDPRRTESLFASLAGSASVLGPLLESLDKPAT